MRSLRLISKIDAHPASPLARLILIVCLPIIVALPLSAQAGSGGRFALVIGNNEYEGLGSLKNPVNDARDIAAALTRLGFKVDLRLNADLSQMEEGAIQLSQRLAADRNSLGLFYYAGHGVQSGGINYLIPSRTAIAAEAFLKTKALSAQLILDLMQGAGNRLNLVFLDACRDNPYAWKRSGTRGLSVVTAQPPGSIIVYATSEGSTADEGTGRNGVFTGELLKHIETPGLDLDAILNRTAQGVLRATGNAQNPAVYKQFFDTTYLAGSGSPIASPSAKAPSFGAVQAAMGSLTVKLASAGTLSVGSLSAAVPAGTIPVNDLPTGSHTVTVRYEDGKTESYSVLVPAGGAASVSFTYVPAPKAAPVQRAPGNSIRGEIYVQGGTFQMGSTTGDDDEMPVRSVTISSYWMMKTEVTQWDYTVLMGKNPSQSKGDDRPVESVTWFDAVVYANKLSEQDGLMPAYRISGTTVDWDLSANGWRLPTEAEWEYAARGGASSRGYRYAGGNDPGTVGWYIGNSKDSTTNPVAKKVANELGLHDLSGNVWEWCWDWYGSYSGDNMMNPAGPDSGTDRVSRGGRWYSGETDLRSANRGKFAPGTNYYGLGFRLVRSIR